MYAILNLSYGISLKTSYLLIYCSVFNNIQCRLILNACSIYSNQRKKCFTFFTFWIWSISCISFTSCFVVVSILLRGYILIVSNLTKPTRALRDPLIQSLITYIALSLELKEALFGHDHLSIYSKNQWSISQSLYLFSQYLQLLFYFFGRGVPSLYRTYNSKVKLLVSLFIAVLRFFKGGGTVL